MGQDTTSRQDVDMNDRRPRGLALAMYSRAAWVCLILTIIIATAVDLGSKHLAFQYVHDEPVVLTVENAADPATDPTRNTTPMHLLPGDLMALRLTLNRGAVFGFGANQRLFFIIFTIAATIGALYVFGKTTRARHRNAHIAIGLILAGAFGNFYDRVVFHAVRDFIQFLPGRMLPDGWTWPGGNPEMFPWVFNIADVLLLVGIIMLMAHIRTKRIKRAHKKQLDAERTTSIAS